MFVACEVGKGRFAFSPDMASRKRNLEVERRTYARVLFSVEGLDLV